jgi:glycosyltransferase involved in cell wall biosynthesis
LRDPAVAAWRSVLVAPTSAAKLALPRVSVCLPYYEQPDFLEAALASLANQTMAPHELIVMDDGSKTPAALAAFAAAEKKYASRGWKFLHQTNAGPAAARNRMVELATGDAVLFCDTDNRFRPEMVATLAHALAATSADCVTCGFQTFTGPNAATEDRGYVFAPLSGCVELGLIENVLGDTNFLVRKSVFQEQGGFTGERLADEDWLFLLQLLLRGRRVQTVPAVLFEYRRIETSRARRQGEFASAAITLAPVLEQTPAAWRRLWPHVVAAIRDPRAATLEHELTALRLTHQAELAQLQQKLGAVEHDLEKTRHALRRSRWEHEARKAAVAAAFAGRDAAQAALRSERDNVASVSAELEALRGEHERAVAELSGKLKRMQATWSWQATAPARAIRRAIIDPLRRPAAATPAATPTPAAVRIESAIDEPQAWDAAPIDGVISGWCLFEGERPATAVRVRLNGEEHTAESRARPDVIAAHGLSKDTRPCGFEVRYRLSSDRDHRAVVEAQDGTGSWHVIREGTLRTTNTPRGARDYAAWVRAYGTVTPEKAAALRNRLAALSTEQRPLISVVMPVHNPPERWLRRAIESVREQIYDRWELCIADDASTAPHVRAVLEEAQRSDARVRVALRTENGHISAASNSALDLATGAWVALLDHDDELSPDALAEMVLTLAECPATDVLYSDEDKIDEAGQRSSPYFKPDFLPDLLLGQNCLSHLTLYRAELVRKVGGFRVGYEGSQDWDLALRVIDETSADRVRHVPKVLYHWRTIAGSTAVAVSAKNYSVDSARRALLDHFSRRNVAADV